LGKNEKDAKNMAPINILSAPGSGMDIELSRINNTVDDHNFDEDLDFLNGNKTKRKKADG